MNQILPYILKKKVTEEEWKNLCLEIFQFQFHNNAVYQEWCKAMGVNNPEKITIPEEIPFLPVEMFKHHKVLSVPNERECPLFFKSSTTLSTTPSFHFVYKPELYHASVLSGFEFYFGDCSQYVFIGILPGYLERGNASLVYMVNYLCQQSGNFGSAIFSDADKAYAHILQIRSDKKIFIIGVTYAILDLILFPSPENKNIILTETGGMKGTRKEMSRRELHRHLKEKWPGVMVRSEYGMTELLSQAWTVNDSDWFQFPPWVRAYVRNVDDPMGSPKREGRGQILIVDLANLYSCSFIATQDVGEVTDGNLRLWGRMDFSDIRGCNLMYER